MYCKNCGEQLTEGVNFCFNCGCKAGNGHGYCGRCGVKANATTCTNCGEVIEDFKEEEKNYNNEQYNQNYQQENKQSYNNYQGRKPKSKVAAGVLGILVGYLGIHRFYLGYVGIGILQLVVTFLTCGLGGIWGFIEGILILCDSVITTDSDGVPLSN